METLLAADAALFLWLNTDLAHPFLDIIMPWITEKRNMYLPGAVVLALIIWRDSRRWWIVLAIALAIVIADQLTSTLMKPMIGRMRPCKTMEGFRLLAHCGSPFGFPSSHATNAAAVTGLLALLYRRWWPLCAVIAVAIGYSRIYVGVHYPLDVLTGWILGMMIAALLYRAIVRLTTGRQLAA